MFELALQIKALLVKIRVQYILKKNLLSKEADKGVFNKLSC